MVGNPLDQEAYEWMERIQSHMGREQFEKVVEEHGFGGMPFIRRSGFEHFSHDFSRNSSRRSSGDSSIGNFSFFRKRRRKN